jgi:hypothetical protein
MKTWWRLILVALVLTILFCVSWIRVRPNPIRFPGPECRSTSGQQAVCDSA